jgi:DNA polymerase/3'-5' exonuclease PolX
MVSKLVDTLEEYSAYLELDGQEGRSHAYQKAANSIRGRRMIPPDPSDIDGVGDAIRTKIAKYQRSGEINELSALKEEYSWFGELKEVNGIGPSRAEQIHEKFNVETLDDLILVGNDLTLLPRVGEKRASNIIESAKKVRDK